MDNDQRDRRDPPESDSTAGEPDEASPRDPETPETPETLESTDATDATDTDPAPSAAEIESWPSQDAGSASEPSQPEETRQWPTDPPEAGSSSSADAWPTDPPERGSPTVDEPRVAGPAWEGAPAEAEPAPEPPPSEVEAYPAAGTTSAHSAPESSGATSESTQCPRCGTENPPGLAFCRNCGQRLVAAGVSTTVERLGTPEGTMACPRCGTHNRAGVGFCQNCGANLRGTAPGYVPPSVVDDDDHAPADVERRGAILGPVVLLIGMVGLITGYLLPFLYGNGSLFDRALGTDGYGAAFWSGYPDVGAALADQAYFGLAAPVPLFALLLATLAVAGFMRARPGLLQTVGLGISLLWSVGLIVGFVVVELAGNWTGDLVGMLRVLTPAGIIFFLSSMIILIGALTRFGRS